ncbi:MAG: hypothetical protein RR828_04815, partial [Oscillospiraceae bacterium]
SSKMSNTSGEKGCVWCRMSAQKEGVGYFSPTLFRRKKYPLPPFALRGWIPNSAVPYISANGT